MLQVISQADHSLTALMRVLLPHNYLFNEVFSFLSFQGLTIIIWLIIAVFTVFLEEKKHPGISKNDILFVISFIMSVIAANFFVYVLKFAIHRHRPVVDFILNCPKDFSFPSAHAATAFAAAAVLAVFDRKRKLFYYFLAGLIAYSRIYLGCHYFFDIFIGALIGIFGFKVILKVNLPYLQKPKNRR